MILPADSSGEYASAPSAEKAKFLPRIVEDELERGNVDEAKKGVRRGLDDDLTAEYEGPVVESSGKKS